MLGALFLSTETSTISIYNVLYGTHTHSHRTEGVLAKVWTHGKCIRYASFASGTIVIWEFGFTSSHEPTRVEVLSTPDNFDPLGNFLIHPTPSRLAFINQRAVLVWDCRETRFLLDFKDVKEYPSMSFSLNGGLFVSGSTGRAIYLWKEFPNGYVLHRKFQSNYALSTIHSVSPDGGSVAGWGSSGIQVWRTMDPATSLSDIVTHPPSQTRVWIVGFSPGEVFAAITQRGDSVVTVLDLKSGDPWLVIDTGVEVYGLGVGRSTIVIVGEGKIVTWDLPTRKHGFDARANIDTSARITTFAQPQRCPLQFDHPLSISTDLHRMAIVGEGRGPTLCYLHLYDVPTGQCLASTSIMLLGRPWFALDGHEVWHPITDNKAEGYSIVEDDESDIIKLECIGVTADPPGGSPWKPSHGYEVTDDGWVLSSSGKRLLWLPPYLRSDSTYREWSGQFLALLHPKLPEPVLLELPAE
jgi:hypothetical protein